MVSHGFALALVVWLSALTADCSLAYYVDCAEGSDAAVGLSPDTSLRTLDRVNELVLRQGDRILLKRGVTCRGSLHPAGSGRPDAPIRMGAFGEGPLPAIDATGEAAAILLCDQEGVERVVDDAGGLAFDHNLYWTPAAVGPGTFRASGVDHEGLHAWQAATGQDAHSLWADPAFLDPGETAAARRGADAFRLGAACPAIDAGGWIEDAGGCDHFGGALGGSTPDIGAHESGAVADPACGG